MPYSYTAPGTALHHLSKQLTSRQKTSKNMEVLHVMVHVIEFEQTYDQLENQIHNLIQKHSSFLGYIYNLQSTKHPQIFSQEVTMNLRTKKKKKAPLKGVTLTSSDTRVRLSVGC